MTEMLPARKLRFRNLRKGEPVSIGNRLRGAFRHLSTPLLPDDYTRLVNPLWSKRELRGQIERVSRPADDVVELVIKPGWGVPADFRAGQYIGCLLYTSDAADE